MATLAAAGFYLGTSSVAFAQVTSDESSSESRRSDGTAPDEEIIVTARKQTERLIDVPQPISVLDAETLLEAQLGR